MNMLVQKFIIQNRLLLFLAFFSVFSCKVDKTTELKTVESILKNMNTINKDSLIFIDFYSLKNGYYSPNNLSKLNKSNIEYFFKKNDVLEIHGSFSDAIEFKLNVNNNYLSNKINVSGIIYTEKDFNTTDKFYDLSSFKNFQAESIKPYFYYYSYENRDLIGR